MCKGTDLKFSFYLPEKAQYQGRFFQYVTPVPDSENLAQVGGDEFLSGDLVVLSGEAKGSRLALRAVKGNMVTLGVVDWKAVAKLRPGDAVLVDNSNFLAAQTCHRHQVPGRAHTSSRSRLSRAAG